MDIEELSSTLDIIDYNILSYKNLRKKYESKKKIIDNYLSGKNKNHLFEAYINFIMRQYKKSLSFQQGEDKLQNFNLYDLYDYYEESIKKIDDLIQEKEQERESIITNINVGDLYYQSKGIK